MKYRIGIDSGGTHIVASSFDEQGQLLKQVTAGPGNIFWIRQEQLGVCWR